MYLDTASGPDAVSIADVGTSLLMNARADSASARTVCSHGQAMGAGLAVIPHGVSLEDESAPSHFDAICDLIALMTSIGRDRAPYKADPLPTGIGISIATKIAHRKRPALIPIFDNDAIFTLFLREPQAQNAVGEASRPFVMRGLDAIRNALIDPQSELAWAEIARVEPRWTRLECFDAVWWVHSEPARRKLRQAREKRPVRQEKCYFVADGLCPHACVGTTPRNPE